MHQLEKMRELMAAMGLDYPIHFITSVRGERLHAYVAASLAKAVEDAVKRPKSLEHADLHGADLNRVNLQSADLRGSDLTHASLVGADLTGAWLENALLYTANLQGAHLVNARLVGADLRMADLRDADLRGANLSRASLIGANLEGANFMGTYLGETKLDHANLVGVRGFEFVKQDLISEILRLPDEIDALRQALVEGRIDGTAYDGKAYDGTCACLAGTMAKAAGIERYQGVNIEREGVTFHASPVSPREQWMRMIRRRQTPENSSVAKLTLEWIDEAIAIRNAIRRSAGSRPRRRRLRPHEKEVHA